MPGDFHIIFCLNSRVREVIPGKKSKCNMVDLNHLNYVSSPVREIELENTAVFELRKLMALSLNEVISSVPKF